MSNIRLAVMVSAISLAACGNGSLPEVPEGPPQAGEAKTDASSKCDSSHLNAKDYFARLEYRDFGDGNWADLEKDSTMPPIPASWSTDGRTWFGQLRLLADGTYSFRYNESWRGNAAGPQGDTMLQGTWTLDGDHLALSDLGTATRAALSSNGACYYGVALTFSSDPGTPGLKGMTALLYYFRTGWYRAMPDPTAG
jgi:hypothetical protein